MKEKVFDLEDRFVEFSASIMDLVELLPNSKAGNYLSGQIIRCGCSPAMNYGEAQSAESRDEFIHKLKVVLKELKETRICLKLITRKQLIKELKLVGDIKKENEELIAIIAKSIDTAGKNNQKDKTD
jgi:four helix bundle protein